MPCHAMPRHGTARHGTAWHGMAWHGMAYICETKVLLTFPGHRRGEHRVEVRHLPRLPPAPIALPPSLLPEDPALYTHAPMPPYVAHGSLCPVSYIHRAAPSLSDGEEASQLRIPFTLLVNSPLLEKNTVTDFVTDQSKVVINRCLNHARSARFRYQVFTGNC